MANPPMYSYKALQLWVLRCCQQTKGGLRDKPGKPADYYHTCYCLSGLSSAQHASNVVLGPPENVLKRADPLCNVVEDKLKAARLKGQSAHTRWKSEGEMLLRQQYD